MRKLLKKTKIWLPVTQRLFQIYQLKTYQQFVEMPTKNNLNQSLIVYSTAGKAVGNQFQQRLRLSYFINVAYNRVKLFD